MVVSGFDFDAALVQARARAKQMVQHGLYSRFGADDAQRIENATQGCLGELAFQHWLESQGIAYQLDEGGFADRNTDEFDFLVNGKKIDVKVAKKTTLAPPADYWRFGVPVDQHPGTKDRIVIGWVDYVRKEVGFYGWMPGSQVAACPVRDTNSATNVPYLTDNHEFRWGDLNRNFAQL